MAMVLNEGLKEHPDRPSGFPVCHSYFNSTFNYVKEEVKDDAADDNGDDNGKGNSKTRKMLALKDT